MMATAKKVCLKKLSDSINSVSISYATKQLVDLQKLLKYSKKINSQVTDIKARLGTLVPVAEKAMLFYDELVKNQKLLEGVFRDCADVRFRMFSFISKQALLVYVDGMTDKQDLERNIIAKAQQAKIKSAAQDTINDVMSKYLTTSFFQISRTVDSAIEQIMLGNALLLIDSYNQGVVLSAAKYVKRNIEEAKSEQIVRGAHDGFNETLNDNIVLVRRRTKDTNVKVVFVNVGRRTKTTVAILYVENLAKHSLVAKIKRRLLAIDIDKILLSHTIQEFISENKWPLFPVVQGTERPDVVVAGLYEGRVAMLVDNTPWALVVPYTYNISMQSVDDYAIQAPVASAIRLLRHFSVLMTVYLPAIYVSIVSFNPGMLPTSLAIYLAELRSQAPFPTAAEAFLMLIMLETLQEAIARLPEKMVVSASVVGGLVIGTTVAQAGLVNPLLVVVISATAIASYSITAYNLALGLRLARFLMIIAASLLGLYGVILGALILLVYMCAQTSFGESFMGDFLQIEKLQDWKDSFVKFPTEQRGKRPRIFGAQDYTRLKGGGG